MEFIKKICKICKNERKFLKGTLRDTENICGNCWDWTISDEDYLERKI